MARSVPLDGAWLTLQAGFRLGAGNDGIDPAGEAVALQVGTFSTWIPPGSFRALGNGFFRFTGRIDGVDLKVDVAPAAAGRYTLTLDASRASLASASGLVTVNVRGRRRYDAGTTQATSRR